eukprot:gene26997-biopygen17567
MTRFPFRSVASFSVSGAYGRARAGERGVPR